MQQYRPLPDRHGGQACATSNLVAPLASTATDTRTTDIGRRPTAGSESGAVSPLIGFGLRRGDVDRANLHSTRPTATTPGTRTSTTATRTTGTRTTSSGLGSSADGTAFGDLPTFEELTQAYFDTRQHKRNKASALAFEQDLERNLRALYDELIDGTYRPSPSICFPITRPKVREVWAAAFRDRIVQRLYYNRLSPHFYRSFIADSCACIPERGTLYAGQRLESKLRSITQNWTLPAYYLKVDIASFFVSINKDILWELVRDRIPGYWWKALAHTLLFHDPREGVEVRGDRAKLALIPPHKSLFQQPAHLGLPIGNIDSQFGANIYMDELDQWAKHRIGARHYIRYVDDILVLHESAAWLNDAKSQIDWLLRTQLGLRLNPAKTIIQPVERGVDFVGHLIKPHYRRTRRRTVRGAMRRVATCPPGELYETANSYFGLFRQASHSHVDRARLAKAVRGRGRCVDRAMTKTFRSKHPC